MEGFVSGVYQTCMVLSSKMFVCALERYFRDVGCALRTEGWLTGTVCVACGGERDVFPT